MNSVWIGISISPPRDARPISYRIILPLVGRSGYSILSHHCFYSFVMTIERVSMDSRGGESLGASGFTNETWGQTATQKLA